MRVVVHGEVSEPGAGVGVHHHLVPLHAVDDDGLASHAVLVVVLVVLVEDGGNLLPILPDGQQRLLVVVGGDVELEEVDASGGTGEDASVNIQSSSNIAVGAMEGEVFFTTSIIRLVPECNKILQFVTFYSCSLSRDSKVKLSLISTVQMLFQNRFN